MRRQMIALVSSFASLPVLVDGCGSLAQDSTTPRTDESGVKLDFTSETYQAWRHTKQIVP